jgi:hypothetical protein
MKRQKTLSYVVLFFLLIASWNLLAQSDALTGKRTPPPLNPPATSYRFAVIGDYGADTADEARVATLVAGWNPDFVITTGDNNYPDGGADTIDQNIGKYYSQFIGNYQGNYGSGSPTNRFWPSLGNHDWQTMGCNLNSCNGAYLDYFTLPGNERYYDVDLGLVHLFALDSDVNEPGGNLATSVQGSWLQSRLSASRACFDVVYVHYPPYSSGLHGSREVMQWPFAVWGAEVVMAGHDHTYERLDVNGVPYFVNGLGGRSLYPFTNVGNLPAGVTSIARYNSDYGAMLVTVTETEMISQFYNASGVLIDEYTLSKPCSDVPPPTGAFKAYFPSIVAPGNVR